MNWQPPAPLQPEAFFLGVRSVLPLLLLLLCAAAVGPVVRWARRRGPLSFRRGCLLWELGSVEQSKRSFRTAARWSSGEQRTAALARLGLAHVYSGEHARAVATLEPLMSLPLPRSMHLLWTALPGYLALCLLLRGDVPRARFWLDEAYRRCEGSATFLVLPEVALLCREGHFGAALRRLEDWWPLLMFEGYLCERTRLLREFARWRLEPERYERECIVEWMMVARLRQQELDFLAAHWPDLARFLSTARSLETRYEGRRGFRAATRTTPA